MLNLWHGGIEGAENKNRTAKSVNILIILKYWHFQQFYFSSSNYLKTLKT